MSPRQYAFLVMGALVALAVGIVVFVIIPTVKEIIVLDRNITQAEKYLEERLARTRRIRRSIERIAEIHDFAMRYAEGFVEPNNELPIITEFEGIAAKTGVNQTLHVDFHAPDDARGSYDIFSFENRAAFADHARYLQAMEHLPAYIFIDKLQWQKQDKNSAADPRPILRFEGKIFTR